MDIHPWTKYEIARLRNEERLQQAQQAQRAVQGREEQPTELFAQPPTAVRLLVRRVLGRRRTIVIQGLVVMGILASTSIALAHGARWAWTERKAERIVTRDATVRLAPAVRAALIRELRASSRYYRGLAIGLREEPHQSPAANEAAEYVLDKVVRSSSAALAKVRIGLAIDAADCSGVGAPVRQRGFGRFRCMATSERLSIPSAVVTFSEDGKIKAVVEGQPRTVRPFQARLEVRVSGKSTIAYRTIG
jgi:hypothetical protein